MTPSQLLEIRRVRAMASSAPDTPQNQCFKGEKGDTGTQGPPGEKGNYGVPASLGYFNDSTFPQIISNSISTNANIMGTVVTWANVDLKFSQGTTGLGYSQGRFYNSSSTDDILLNVSGFISFFPNTSGTRSVYARLSGVNSDIYGYTQVDAVNTPGAATVVPFSFNIFLKANVGLGTISGVTVGGVTVGAYNYFEILVIQTATPAGTSLSINNSTSRISMTRINTSIKGDTGPAGLTAAQINAQITSAITNQGITSIVSGLLTSSTFSPKTFGNVLIVDNLFGTTGNVNSLYQTYLTIESAIASIGGLSNKTIWLLPGTYILSGNTVTNPAVTGNVGITIPNNCSIRGMSAQTVKIQMSVSTNTTMILMGENTRIEDCTIELISSTTCDLTGILFYGTSAFTSQIKGCIITIYNYNIATSTNVTGVLANGIGATNTPTISLALEQANGGSLSCVEDSTIQIISNYNGLKRGIVVGGGSSITTNMVNIRNTNIFLKNPATSPGGSYCAIENNSPTSKIQCFNCVICGPTTASTDDFSDISQTAGEIVIGEGTTLVNKRSRLTTPSALSGSYPFKLLTNTTTLFYAALGNINDFPVNTNGYLVPGTMMIQNYPYPAPPTSAVYNFQYPSTNIPSTCYIIPKKSILMSTRVRLGKQQSTMPSSTTPPAFQLFVTIHNDRTPVTGLNPTTRQLFTIILTHTDTQQTYPNSVTPEVFVLEEGSQLRVSMSYTGGTANAGEDLYVQLELY
jgi:hypothetical protein